MSGLAAEEGSNEAIQPIDNARNDWGVVIDRSGQKNEYSFSLHYEHYLFLFCFFLFFTFL